MYKVFFFFFFFFKFWFCFCIFFVLIFLIYFGYKIFVLSFRFTIFLFLFFDFMFMFTLYLQSHLFLHIIPQWHFQKFYLKKVTCHTRDLVSIQVDGFDGHVVFCINVRYIVRVFHRFLNIGLQNAWDEMYFSHKRKNIGITIHHHLDSRYNTPRMFASLFISI